MWHHLSFGSLTQFIFISPARWSAEATCIFNSYSYLWQTGLQSQFVFSLHIHISGTLVCRDNLYFHFISYLWHAGLQSQLVFSIHIYISGTLVSRGGLYFHFIFISLTRWSAESTCIFASYSYLWHAVLQSQLVFLLHIHISGTLVCRGKLYFRCTTVHKITNTDQLQLILISLFYYYYCIN